MQRAVDFFSGAYGVSRIALDATFKPLRLGTWLYKKQ
jgi:hypothetical protein